MLHYKVVVGAYFECRTKKIKADLLVKSCPKEDCPLHKSETDKNYCWECGTKISENKVTKLVDGVDFSQIVVASQLNKADCENFEDLFSLKELDSEVTHYYVSNTKVGHHLFDPSQMNNYVTQVKPSQILDDIENLHDQHRSDLSVLRKAYGLDNVDIKWGLIFIGY